MSGQDAITETERWAIEMRGRVAEIRESMRFGVRAAGDVRDAARRRGVYAPEAREMHDDLVEARAQLGKHLHEAELALVLIRRLMTKVSEQAEENRRSGARR